MVRTENMPVCEAGIVQYTSVVTLCFIWLFMYLLEKRENIFFKRQKKTGSRMQC